MLGTTLHAQDLEPRAYSNSPVGLNFVIAGYGHASGTVLTDPSLPLENVSNETHVGVLGFATTFGAFGQTGQFGLIVPYASIAAKGLVLGSPHARYVDGFADTAFRLSMNFVGAPALTAAEFKNYHQDLIVGMSLRVTAPLSQYDGDKLVKSAPTAGRLNPRSDSRKHSGHGRLSSLLASLFTRTIAIFSEARRGRWRRFTLCNQGSAIPSRLAAGWR